MSQKTLEAIVFSKHDNTLKILDQLLLPYNTHYITIESIDDAFNAIKLMQVRGAPAIAIVGAFAITVDIWRNLSNSKRTIADLMERIDYLETSRPTAVNLSNALNDIKHLLRNRYEINDVVDATTFEAVKEYSVGLHEGDLSNNYTLGDNGVKYITETLKKQSFKGPFSIVTVCNTGSLATAGHGTALGIIRSVHSQLKKGKGENDFWFEHAYPLETRPYNQGARLTAYELAYEKIPFTLICDNMVTSLISSLNKNRSIKDSSAPVKFIIVGADRVVKNGDSANKIGTFQLAAIANYFNSSVFSEESQKISFIVAAPTTTIDYKSASGDNIVIEERPSRELTTLEGPLLDKDGNVGKKKVVGIAPPGIQVWNPAFDVTPHELIDAIVTEKYPVYQKNDGEFLL